MCCPPVSSRSATSDYLPTETAVRRWPCAGFISAPWLQISARCYPNSRSLHSSDPVPSANAAPCMSSRVAPQLSHPALAQRFTAQPSTLLEHDDADLFANPTPHRDGRSPRPRSPMPRFGSAQFTTAIQPVALLPCRGTNSVSYGSLCIPSCPVGRLRSPQAASNPHTSTALAAYCKSPYRERSGLGILRSSGSLCRSARDTALMIYQQEPGAIRPPRFRPNIPDRVGSFGVLRDPGTTCFLIG